MTGPPLRTARRAFPIRPSDIRLPTVVPPAPPAEEDPPPEDALVDEDALGRVLRALGEVDAAQLLGAMAEDVPVLLDAIERAAADGQPAPALRALHSLAGSAGLLGLARLHRVASALELRWRAAGPASDGARKADLRRLRAVCSDTVALLQKRSARPERPDPGAEPAGPGARPRSA